MILTYNQTLIKRKKIIYIALILIFISAFVLLLLPHANAGIKKTLEDALNWFLKNCLLSNNSETAYDVIYKSPIYTENVAINTFVQSILNVSKSFAAAWFMVTIFIEIINEFSSGKEPSFDRFLPVFIKAAVTLTLIICIDEAIMGIQKGMPAFFTEINKAINIQGDVNELKSTLANFTYKFGAATGFLAGVLELLVLKLLTVIINAVVMFVVYISAYTIVIEFTLRRVFMPIAIVNFMNDGVRGPGMRFIKKFISLYIRTFITLAAFGLSDKLSNNALIEYIKSIGGGSESGNPASLALDMAQYNILFTIAASKFARKGSELADEVVGV